jgi:ElaB/YqjD/DUF883 family membrane-anchored ribosome-binding protein
MDAARQETGMAGDDMAAQLGRLQDELRALKETMASFGKPPGRETGGACNCAACVEAASQLARHARQDAEAAIADLETFARKNPRYVLGGALGVGLVLGLLLQRR